jgi:hypothetical protein
VLDRGEHVEACHTLATLERDTPLHRPAEVEAVAAIRAAARALRAELRAAGRP